MSAGTTPRHTRIGRYEVTGWLGAGSFAAVYRAYDPALDAPVAIKVLADHHSSNPELRERFIQEARMLRRLSSDRVVTVRDIGEIDGQPYFVMDAFDHGTLDDRLTTFSARPELADVHHLINELERCLDAVHQGGLIHRDIKPSNLLIGSDSDTPATDQLLGASERLVLGDFGIARNADATGLTRGAGTYGFMAPEQNAPLTTVDHRADIYAATAIVQLVLQRRWSQADTPLALRGALSDGVATDPDDRPPTASAWGQHLRSALPDTPPAVAIATPRRGRARVAAGAAAAVLACLVAVFFVRAGDNGPKIVGPETVQLGTTATYSYDSQDDARYRWTDSAGGSHDSPALEITPRSTGILELSLEETIDGATETSTIRVRVVDS